MLLLCVLHNILFISLLSPSLLASKWPIHLPIIIHVSFWKACFIQLLSPAPAYHLIHSSSSINACEWTVGSSCFLLCFPRQLLLCPKKAPTPPSSPSWAKPSADTHWHETIQVWGMEMVYLLWDAFLLWDAALLCPLTALFPSVLKQKQDDRPI